MARRAEVVSMKDELVAPVRPMLQMLSFAVALLLLIACANVVSLFLARTESRRHEMAIRTALGATRRQLLRQFAIEGALLASCGGAIGIAAAAWMVRLVVLIVPPDVPRVGEIGVRLPVLILMTVASAAIGGLAGLAPAWRATRTGQLAAFSRSEATATARSGFRRVGSRTLVVVMEVAMAVVLCVGAGLLVRSFITLVNVNPGYDARNVMTFQIVLPSGHAGSPGLYDDVLSRLEVDRSSRPSARPMYCRSPAPARFNDAGRPAVSPGPTTRWSCASSAGYFQAIA
jgi:hypothetical protein